MLHIGVQRYNYNHYFNGRLDAIRISKGIARWSSNFTPENAGHFETASGSVVTIGSGADTKLLIQSNNTDGSKNIEDTSIFGKEVTVNGDVQHSTGANKLGNTSLYFDGTGDYLHLNDSADWDFGSGDFTIDFWYKDDGTV